MSQKADKAFESVDPSTEGGRPPKPGRQVNPHAETRRKRFAQARARRKYDPRHRAGK